MGARKDDKEHWEGQQGAMKDIEHAKKDDACIGTR
jgi:hypothetical protein